MLKIDQTNNQNFNGISFNAKFRVKKHPSYVPPKQYFSSLNGQPVNNEFNDVIKELRQHATYIGTKNDIITVTLKENNLEGKVGKQSVSVSANINDITVKKDFDYEYHKLKNGPSSGHYNIFYDRMYKVLNFLDELSKCKVSPHAKK